MDSQRLLFKKFFNSPGNNGNNNNNNASVNDSSGFNPPKFYFNKKKLGLIQAHEIREDSNKVSEKEIIKHGEAEESCLEFDCLDVDETVEIIDKSCLIESFQNAKVKYDLRCQLSEFNDKVENLMRVCDEKGRQLDWLLIGMDERMAEIRAVLES